MEAADGGRSIGSIPGTSTCAPTAPGVPNMIIETARNAAVDLNRGALRSVMRGVRLWPEWRFGQGAKACNQPRRVRVAVGRIGAANGRGTGSTAEAVSSS